MRTVTNAEQVINVEQDPVQEEKSQSFSPTKTFLCWQRFNASFIFSALPCGDPRSLETRYFWKCPLCRPPGLRTQPSLTFFFKQLYWDIKCSIHFHKCIHPCDHYDIIKIDILVVFSFGIQFYEFEGPYTIKIMILNSSITLKNALVLPLSGQTLPLSLAPDSHWSILIFVPIAYKLDILKTHNSEKEMFRQYLVFKQ